MLSIDHLVIAVADLVTAARHYQAEYGIPFASGGIHPGGTTNSANLFPDGSYIELLAVHDASLPYAAVVRRFLERHGDGLFHWALRTDDIETIAARAGITPTVGWIDSIEGERQPSWRIVSHPDARGVGVGLPFFIQYDHLRASPQERRERARANGIEVTEGSIEWVEVGADAQELAAWIGHHSLDIRVDRGGHGAFSESDSVLTVAKLFCAERRSHRTPPIHDPNRRRRDRAGTR